MVASSRCIALLLGLLWPSVIALGQTVRIESVGQRDSSQEKPSPSFPDLVYKEVDGMQLTLDLYLPNSAASGKPPRRSNQDDLRGNAAKAPLIVWVHGGAWRAGSKDSVPIWKLLDHGYAIASVDYRLSTTAQFPAQVIDIRDAMEYLQLSDQYAIDAERVIIAGASAGGHLAALVGVSEGVDFHARATKGNALAENSEMVRPRIRAIVSFYGASNLNTILSQSTPHGLSVRVPALELLLGGTPETKKELATLASPVAHVDSHDPPLLLLHGDQDPQMPINQSHELQGRYQLDGLAVQFEVVHGAAHGGNAFYTDDRLELVDQFIKRHVGQP